ncbi:MAG: deoxyribose-phosphate aldolase [Phycisphaerales bacterium]|nr:deoxyribose-phosphate aldolase [Phycisphaerales bacterium]
MPAAIPASPTVDRVMADARAGAFATRSIKKDAKVAGLLLAVSMIDLTTLEGKDSPEKVRSLCRKALRPFDADEAVLGFRVPPVAAVCVYPSMVGAARELLDGTGVRVASVATGFPSGQYPIEIRLEDVRDAVRDGADEIDMVINRGAFLAGRHDEVADEIRRVAEACGVAHLKVILETGELETYDNIRRASDIAIACIRDGDFIKTSTGKVSPAATMPVTLVMLEAIRDELLRSGRRIGMKPAGGIRTSKQALHYLVMVKETLGDGWLTPTMFRFGASSLLNDLLRQLVKEKTGRYAAWHDFAEA